MRLNQGEKPRPLVVLFDMLNAGESSRGAVWSAVKTSLAHLQSTGLVYLYLLTEDGSLYPVHALPGTAVAQSPVDADWENDIGPLMDAAMRKVNQVKPLEFRAASPTSLQARFGATYHALDDMRAVRWVWHYGLHGRPGHRSPTRDSGSGFARCPDWRYRRPRVFDDRSKPCDRPDRS